MPNDGVLHLFRGQSAPFWLEVTVQGAVVPLTQTYDQVRFSLRQQLASPPDYQWTEADKLTLEESRIKVELGLVTANALVPARYYGQVALKSSASGEWEFSKLFWVDIHAQAVQT